MIYNRMFLILYKNYIFSFKDFIENLDRKNKNKKKYVRVNFQEEQKTMPIKYTKYFCVKCYYVMDPKIST
jgi:hypothetical protein